MLTKTPGNPEMEYHRIKKLSEFDLDYSQLHNEFKNIVALSASIAGTEVSLINIIDNYTQWTVSAHATNLKQMPKENSVCVHTIRLGRAIEILRLDRDERFMAQPYVIGEKGYTYYFGVPLSLASGENIGALCVLDKNEKKISDASKKQLHILAAEIVDKLEAIRRRQEQDYLLEKVIKTKNQLAHDIRGPIIGITGLAESATEDDLSKDEMQSYFQMIHKSGDGLIELTNDILSKADSSKTPAKFEISLKELRERFLDLYSLPAHSKNIDFQVDILSSNVDRKIPKRKLLSIAGNLISNAIKFTHTGGNVSVTLNLSDDLRSFEITVIDNGVGIPKSVLSNITNGNTNAEPGTIGEKGFGLGLKLVDEIVKDLNGRMHITSSENKGTSVQVKITVN